VTLGFIVRATFTQGAWTWTVHDLASGRRQRCATLEACGAALRAATEALGPAASLDGRLAPDPAAVAPTAEPDVPERP